MTNSLPKQKRIYSFNPKISFQMIHCSKFQNAFFDVQRPKRISEWEKNELNMMWNREEYVCVRWISWNAIYREPLHRTPNDWAVWAFFMTNVSSFFCSNALELLNRFTCVLLARWLWESLYLNRKNPLQKNSTHTTFCKLWPKESVVFTQPIRCELISQ